MKTPALARVAMVVAVACGAVAWAGQTPPPAARKPLDQVMGTVTAVDAAAKTFTLKEDKTGTEFVVNAANARRFLKVPPGEKDLRKARPIDASGISAGDRLLARGEKDPAGAPKLEAAIVLVMTATDLEKRHQAELEDWQKRGSRGVIAAIDDAAHSVTITEHTPAGPKTVTVVTTASTRFTRYSPESVKFSDAKPSTFAELKVGDQLRVLGDAIDDGSKVTAEDIVSGAFRTLAGTVVSVSSDNKEIKVNDLQTKQLITVALSDDSSVRRIPPMMANFLAMRLNPNFRPAGAGAGAGPGAGAGGGRPAAAGGPAGAGQARYGPAGQAGGAGGPGARAGGAGGRMNGDLSQMVERLPKISASDLKPGDAVIISGGAGADAGHLTAINVIAGVEPLFASAPPRAGQAALGMWNLDISVPEQ